MTATATPAAITFGTVNKVDVRIAVGQDYLVVGTATLVETYQGIEVWAADDAISGIAISEFNSSRRAVEEIKGYFQEFYLAQVDISGMTTAAEALTAFRALD